MTFNWFENSSPASKIMLSLAFMVSILIIGFFVGLIIAIPIFGKGIFEIINAGSNISSPENMGILKYIQTVQSVSLFVIPPILLAFLFGSKPLDYLKLKVHPKWTSIVIVSVLIIVAIPFVNFTEMVNSKLSLPSFMSGLEQWMKNAEESAKQLTEAFLFTSNISSLMVNLFVMAVIPAIGEELVFRGLLQRLFTEWFKNNHWGIIASAVVFSAFHFQFYGFIPRMLLGVAFGYFLVWSGSLWLPIAAHFVNNALGVLYFYLSHNGYVSDRLDKIGTEGSEAAIMIVISAVLATGLILLLRRSYSRLRNTPA